MTLIIDKILYKRLDNQQLNNQTNNKTICELI